MKIVTFGEIMLRLKTPEHLRIIQSQNFDIVVIELQQESHIISRR